MPTRISKEFGMPLATLYVCDFCGAETQWPINWMKLAPAKYDAKAPNPPVVIMCEECILSTKHHRKGIKRATKETGTKTTST